MKVIEDVGIVKGVGEVRGVRDTKDGISLGVELTGLSDSNIDKYIRVTNAALRSVSDSNKDVPDSGNAVERVAGQISAQGA